MPLPTPHNLYSHFLLLHNSILSLFTVHTLLDTQICSHNSSLNTQFFKTFYKNLLELQEIFSRMAINSESTPPPPPRIGKIGPYTVFMTPPSTPNSTSTEKPAHSNLKTPAPPVQFKPVQTPPPVQQVEKTCPVWSPPLQYEKPSMQSHSSFGFFWNALAKVQNAHASLDEHVAYWFGLNQSKYQWALDDYYENKGISQAEEKAKAAANKLENV